MDHTECKEYLSRLGELSPAQKRKVSHVMRIGVEASHRSEFRAEKWDNDRVPVPRFPEAGRR